MPYYGLYRTYWFFENIALCQELEDFCVVRKRSVVSTQEFPMKYVLEKTRYSEWYDEDPETVFPRLLDCARKYGKRLIIDYSTEEKPYTINIVTKTACGSTALYRWISITEMGREPESQSY